MYQKMLELHMYNYIQFDMEFMIILCYFVNIFHSIRMILYNLSMTTKESRGLILHQMRFTYANLNKQSIKSATLILKFHENLLLSKNLRSDHWSQYNLNINNQMTKVNNLVKADCVFDPLHESLFRNWPWRFIDMMFRSYRLIALASFSFATFFFYLCECFFGSFINKCIEYLM